MNLIVQQKYPPFTLQNKGFFLRYVVDTYEMLRNFLLSKDNINIDIA